MKRRIISMLVASSVAGLGSYVSACSSGGDDGKMNAESLKSGDAATETAKDAGTEAANEEVADAGAEGSPGTTCELFDGSLNEVLVANGEQFVLKNHCNGCHQAAALDAGGLTLSGKDHATNLTPDTVTGVGCWSDDNLSKAILDGVGREGQTLCVMPHFRVKFEEAGVDPEVEANSIVQFIRSLPTATNTTPSAFCGADE